MNIILFGFKGCGKTHFGKLAAQALNCPFLDSDDLLVNLFEKEYGKRETPRNIYQSLGNAAFRELEKKAILVFRQVTKSVIALGGGTVLDSQNFEFLSSIGKMIYLEASLETLKKRNISLLEGPLEKIYFDRLPIYRSLSSPCINVDLLDESTVVSTLCSIFHQEN